MNHFFLLGVLLLNGAVGVAVADEAALQSQIDALKSRVDALEAKPARAAREYVCAATCIFWWKNEAFPREYYSLHATGETMVKAYEEVQSACRAKHRISGYQNANWYLGKQNGDPMLVTTKGACQLN